MREIALFGRDKEIEWVKSSIDQSIKGKPCFRFVEGEMGIGKTSLQSFAETYFLKLAPKDLMARHQCLNLSGDGEKFLPWIKCIGSLVSNTKEEPPKGKGIFNRLSANKEKIFNATKAITAAIPGMGIVSAGLQIGEMIAGGSTPSSELDGKLEKYAENPEDFFSDFIINWAKTRPLLILFDDIQWIDLPSVNVLNSIFIKTYNTKPRPALCFMGAYRTIESTEKSSGLDSINSFIKTIGRRYGTKDSISKIKIKPLGKNSAISVINSTLNNSSNLSADALNWLVEKSTGNPFLIKKYVEILIDNNVIENQDEQYVLSDKFLTGGSTYTYKGKLLELVKSGIFDEIEELFLEGIKQLEEKDIKLLKHACIQGIKFGATVLSESLGWRLGEVYETLSVLHKRGIINETGEGYLGIETQQTFSFSSEAFFLGVQKLVFASQKKLIASIIAKFYEDKYKVIKDLGDVNSSISGMTKVSMDEEFIHDRSEELGRLAVKYYRLAGHPLETLKLHLELAENTFKESYVEGVGTSDKKSIKKREELFKICDEIDGLIEDCKKSKILIGDLREGLILESKMYLLKGNIFEGLEIYNEASSAYLLASKGVSWIDGHSNLKFKILLQRLCCFLMAGMYESARSGYGEMQEFIEQHDAEILKDLDNLKLLMKVLELEDVSISGPIYLRLNELSIEYGDPEISIKLALGQIGFIAESDSSKDEFREGRVQSRALKLADSLLLGLDNNSKITHKRLFDEFFSSIIDEVQGLFHYEVLAVDSVEDLDYRRHHTGLIECFKDWMWRLNTVHQIMQSIFEFNQPIAIEYELDYISLLLDITPLCRGLLGFIKDAANDADKVGSADELIQEFIEFVDGKSRHSPKVDISTIERLANSKLPSRSEVKWALILANFLGDLNADDIDQDRLPSMHRFCVDILDRNNEFQPAIDSRVGFLYNLEDSLQLMNPNELQQLPEMELFLEAESLYRRHESDIDDDEKGLMLWRFGDCWEMLNQIEKAFSYYKESLGKYLDANDFDTFKDTYKDVEKSAKKHGLLGELAELKSIYKKQSKRKKDQDDLIVLDNEILSNEVSAALLEEQADEEEDIAISIGLYDEAIKLLAEVPYGYTYQDNLHEKISDLLVSVDLVSFDIEERQGDWLANLSKALEINLGLNDFGRVFDLNDKIMDEFNVCALGEYDKWLERFYYHKKLAFVHGDLTALGLLFKSVVPDFDPDFDPSEYKDREEYIGFFMLESKELVKFYNELIGFYGKYTLLDRIEKTRSGLEKFSIRMDMPEILSQCSK